MLKARAVRRGVWLSVLIGLVLLSSADRGVAQEYADLAAAPKAARTGRSAIRPAGGAEAPGTAGLPGPNLPTASSLAYRFPVDDRFELVSTTHLDAPVIGAIEAVVTTKLHVEASDATGMRTTQDITSRSPGHADYHLVVGCRITPVGQVRDITGIDPSNSTQALVAKNLGVGLPALPNTPVQVGTTWGTEKPFYLPKVSVPGVPDVIRIRSTYTVLDLGDRSGTRTVSVRVTVVESPGQKTTVTASGTWLLEHATGKPLSGAIRGVAVLRTILGSKSCPFRLDVLAR